MPEGILPPDTAFQSVLNSHGYSFQYSVIRLAERLYGPGRCPWLFEWAEFPVSVGSRDTRIDLVLRKYNTHIYLIGECKRVNPALGHWCFARAPYTHRSPAPKKLLVESIEVVSLDQVAPVDSQQPYRLINTVSSSASDVIYHVGRELRSNEKGESQASTGRGAIEEATGQVLLGVNGMIQHIAAHHEVLRPGNKITLVPVIFTTANLWTSEVDLGAADLATGRHAPDTAQLTSQSWIWLNYNQSPSLKHSFPIQNLNGRDVLETEYTRSIAVVNALGIEDFLQRSWF